MAHARAKLLNDKKGSYESVNTNIQGSPVLSISQKKEEFAWRSSPQGDTQFPVVHYEEQLYLNQALVIGAKTIWKFVVQETKSSKAQHIHVGVSKNNTASQNILQSVSIDILHCQSYEECKTLQDHQLIPTDLPSWSAYKISSDLEEHSDTAYYVVVLQKPENYGASMEPTQFYFKGTYENPQECWELESSLAIVLADYSPKSFETAFGILAFTNFDYSPNVYFQPNAKVHWKHFLSFIDSHCAGATNNERKISDRVNLLSPLHLDSIMRLTQCDDNKVTMKRVRYFCNESQAGGVVPPLIQIEKTIQRYPKCWEKGLIVGVISSTVAKQYLLGQGHSVGSFILRMQYNSPAEVCASSVQIHPQSGATFVDHFTIPKNVAVDDWSLMEYLAHSSIHQVLLPIQQLCAPSMLHSEPSPTSSNNVSSYRTTDQQLQRTTDLLHTIHEQPSPVTTEPISFNVSLQENPDNSFAALSHTDSSVLMKSENSSTLDPKVYKWLVDLFGEDSTVLQEVVKPFEEERVTFSSLEVLDGSDLKEMGIPVGPRKQLLQALQDTFL